MALASLDRRSENVRVLAIVVAKLELGNIERHICPAHFVECADHAALEDRPEAFNRLSMDCANDILAPRMVNDAMRIFTVKTLVANPLIGTEQANFMRDCFADEGGERSGIHVCDHTRDHIALAAYGADDRRFTGTNAAGSTAATAFIPMPVFGQATNESFIDFDNSAELINVFHESGSDFVAHEPSGFIRTEAHVAHDLQRAHAFLAGEHQVDDAIPVAKRFVGILKNRIDQDRESITGGTARGALRALPMPFARWQVIYSRISATGATNALGPTTRLQVRLAGVFVWKHPLKLRGGKLMNRLRLFAARHGVLHPIKGRYHV
jgi:hypothetical protein